jgi:hypothetical protein
MSIYASSICLNHLDMGMWWGLAYWVLFQVTILVLYRTRVKPNGGGKRDSVYPFSSAERLLILWHKQSVHGVIWLLIRLDKQFVHSVICLLCRSAEQ